MLSDVQGTRVETSVVKLEAKIELVAVVVGISFALLFAYLIASSLLLLCQVFGISKDGSPLSESFGISSHTPSVDLSHKILGMTPRAVWLSRVAGIHLELATVIG